MKQFITAFVDALDGIDDLFGIVVSNVMELMSNPTAGEQLTYKEFMSKCIPPCDNPDDDKLTKLLVPLIDGCNDMRVYMTTVYKYDIMVLDCKDISLKDRAIRCADAINISYDVSSEEYSGRQCIIVLGRKNPAFTGENSNHIIYHELTHMVLDYILFMDNIKITDEFDYTEFICDFLPIYHFHKNEDYIQIFLDYCERWFKKDLIKKYKSIIKKLVKYLNKEITP